MNEGKYHDSQEAVTIPTTSYLSDEVVANVKSIYHLFNAKPDTTIKVFNKNRVITFDDILHLNDKLQAKFKNHQIESIGSSIIVNLSKGTSKEFGNWSEFSRMDWNIGHRTTSISIQWDLLLTLPHYKLPQRHTIKVRIGSHLKPEEVFKLVMESESESEIIQSVSDIVCKIDFVNDIFCDEIISIVDNWYDSLAKDSTTTRTGLFIKKHSETISNTISALLPILAIVIIFIFTYDLLGAVDNIDIILSVYHVKILLLWLFISFIFYIIFDYAGKKLSKLSLSKSKKINNAPLILMTKGDKYALEKTDKQNNKLIKEFILNFIVSTMGPIGTVIYGIIKGILY